MRMLPCINKRILLTFTLFILTGATYAQTFMVLEKMGTKKRYVYYMGETIEYQLKGEKTFNSERITNILDSAFVAYNDTVSFKAVERINIKPKRKASLLNIAGPSLIIAGLGYLAIDQINKGIVQGGGGSTWDSSVATTSFIIAGTGALIIVLQKNKVPLSGWWRLRKVNVY